MHHHIPSEVPVRYLPRDRTMSTVAGVLVVVGLLAFVVRLMQDADSAWISYVTNWLFFTSIAMGSVMFAVATWIVKAKWNWPMRRISQSGAAFLPMPGSSRCVRVATPVRGSLLGRLRALPDSGP